MEEIEEILHSYKNITDKDKQTIINYIDSMKDYQDAIDAYDDGYDRGKYNGYIEALERIKDYIQYIIDYTRNQEDV